MRNWLINFGMLLLFLYTAISHYHRGDFFKIVVAAISLVLIGHIMVGAWRGLLWLLSAMIIADLKEKLRKEYGHE